MGHFGFLVFWNREIDIEVYFSVLKETPIFYNSRHQASKLVTIYLPTKEVLTTYRCISQVSRLDRIESRLM